MKISFSKDTYGYTTGDLSYWDIVKLMLGREIHVGSSIIRLGIAYQAFNTSAPEAAPLQRREDRRAAEQFDGFSDYHEKGSDNIPPISHSEPDAYYRFRLLDARLPALAHSAVVVSSGKKLDQIGLLYHIQRHSVWKHSMRTAPVSGGYIDKGGHNDGSSQIKERPPAPAPMKGATIHKNGSDAGAASRD